MLQRRIAEINGRLRPVYFDADSWEVTGDSLSSLQADAAELTRLGSFTARIEGHTDLPGSEGYNHWLGLWRAKSVKDHLRDQGLDPARFSLRTRGTEAPAAPPGEDGAQPLNRRVEIVVIALD